MNNMDYDSTAFGVRFQIINEGMLEDVNNILNSGDVPNLYGVEELERISTACRPICAKKRIPATKLNIFAQVCRRRHRVKVASCSDGSESTRRLLNAIICFSTESRGVIFRAAAAGGTWFH